MVSRRGFLCGVATLATVPSGFARAFSQAQNSSAFGPFRMGIQSYSLRGMKLDAALAATRALGLDWWEGWEGHVPISDSLAERGECRLKLLDAGVRMRTFGVVSFGADEARNRKVFEFAQAMGVRTLSADPTPEAFDSLERLTREFSIDIAIHNHGPGSRYDRIADVDAAIRNRGPRIGACVDTGHFLRSKEDPVRAIRTFGSKVFGVHLKDVADASRFTVLGKGDLDLSATLRLLAEQRYSGILSLEYEENPSDPLPDIRLCLKAIQEALR
jgi:inosose dehydratase